MTEGLRCWGFALIGLLLGPAVVFADDSCFGATFDTIESVFEYKAFLDTSAEACPPGSIRATRLFIAGACGRRHNNNFNGYPPHCPSGDWNVMNSSSDTCESVFAQAMPADIKLPNGNEVFDHGRICNQGVRSVMFIQTNCSQLTASSVVLQQRRLEGEYCWDGKVLTAGKLAGIIIGGTIGIALLITIPMLLYACYKRRQLRRKMKAMQKDVEATFKKDPMMPFGFGLSSGSLGGVSDTTSMEDVYDIEFETETEVAAAHQGIPFSRVGEAEAQ